MRRFWHDSCNIFIIYIVLATAMCTTSTHAVTRYVHGTSGNDAANSCATATGTDPAAAKRTIAAGLACTAGGDELIVRGGTGGSCIVYTEPLLTMNNGSAGAYTILRVPGQGHLKGGECATIQPQTGRGGGDTDIFGLSNRHHLIIEGFKLDGAPSTNTSLTDHSIRYSSFIIRGQDDSNNNIIVRYNEMMRTIHSCTLIMGSNWEFRENLVHHCGWFTANSYGITDAQTGEVSTGDSHGFYFEGNNSLITGNTFHHNPAYHIQIYGNETVPMDNVIVENNRFSTARCGMLTMQGSGHIIRNNLEYDDGHNEDLDHPGFGPQWSGVGCSAGGSPAANEGIIIDGGGQKIINNTIYKGRINDKDGDCGSGCEIRNNIICEGGGINLLGTGVQANNLTGTCPGFINAGAGNFHLAADDPSLAPRQANALLDFDGVSRRVNTARGAYEFVTGGGTPVATKLRFQVQPSNTTVNTSISPPIKVEILDQFDVLMPSASTNVTLTKASGPGTMTGGGSTATASGVATFSAVQFNTVGTGFTITATSSTGLSPVTSTAFNVNAVGGTLRYVAPTGTNVAGCLTSTPATARCHDINYCVSQMTGGDTCIIADGTYVEGNIAPPSGTPGNLTTLRRDNPTDNVLIRPNSGSVDQVVLITTGMHDVVFDGLNLDASDPSNVPVSAFVVASVDSNSTNITIKNSILKGGRHGSFMGGTNWLVTNNLIASNGANSASDDGLYFIGTGSTISYNQFSNPGSCFNLNLTNTGASSNIIDGNTFSNSQCGIAIGDTGQLYKNNVQYDGALADPVGGLRLSGTAHKVLNNTFVRNTVFIESSANVASNQVKNNISCSRAFNGAHGAGLGATTNNNNLDNVCPAFISDAAHNYRMQPTATNVIGQGVCDAAVPIDADHVARTAPCDIGAYEFVGAEPPPTGILALWQAWMFF